MTVDGLRAELYYAGIWRAIIAETGPGELYMEIPRTSRFRISKVLDVMPAGLDVSIGYIKNPLRLQKYTYRVSSADVVKVKKLK